MLEEKNDVKMNFIIRRDAEGKDLANSQAGHVQNEQSCLREKTKGINMGGRKPDAAHPKDQSVLPITLQRS